MTLFDLSADDVLDTTRAVRKRLDFSRPVDDDLIRECVATAMQAPSGSNLMTMQFVVVKDPDKRNAIGEIYKQCWAIYTSMPLYAGAIQKEGDAEQAQQSRVVDSATYLSEHMAEAPALARCTAGRINEAPAMMSASSMGNILPGMWSFMLAARARGSGTAWTTISPTMEKEVADVVGIPFDDIQQACLSPLAYTVGTDFKRAPRPESDSIIQLQCPRRRPERRELALATKGFMPATEARAVERGGRSRCGSADRSDARSRLVLRAVDDLARRCRRAFRTGVVRRRSPSRALRRTRPAGITTTSRSSILESERWTPCRSSGRPSTTPNSRTR